MELNIPINFIEPMPKEEFDALSKKERRLIVANDVIATIVAGVFVPRNHGFLFNEGDYMGPLAGGVAAERIREARACHGCALGGLAVAACLRFNGHTEGEVHDLSDSNIRNGWAGFFSKRQLCLIESAFEMTDYRREYRYPKNASGGHRKDVDLENAVEFGEEHQDAANRLVAIMQCIIDHKGLFVPKDRYDVVDETYYIAA